ncbi:DNA topoisomerase IA [Pseudomonas nitritireducens]|uniref:DNA topoisomerase n=1 Tax=Pseudomonas nitroreducens TaxID=46680 RepID=A0A7W7KEI2_PSENT|nr:DNA topoisomerase [Pseudomonas nitritireducens]MBB4861371.1 DNA topoisomerase IA [Pseudomonas nitritireducens]
MSSYTAVVCEKGPQAKDLAAALGWQRTNRGYEGTHKGRLYVMQWARGHLTRHLDPDEITPGLGWENPFALAPIPRAVKTVPVIEEPDGSNKELSQDRLKRIGSVLKDADSVVIATDPDREGEWIGWAIIEHFNFKGKVERLWLSEGYDKVSVDKAFTNLLPGHVKKSGYRSAEARGLCDRAYMHLVRDMTYWARRGAMGRYLGRGNKRESVVSSGRVQGAALYLIWLQEQKIKNFVAQPFFNIFGDFDVKGTPLTHIEYAPKVTQEIIDSQPKGVLWVPRGNAEKKQLDEPLWADKAMVDDFKRRLMENAHRAIVIDYKEAIKSDNPDGTFHLVEAKSLLIKATKINGEQAQAVFEDLYLQGYTSYARTDKKEIPQSFYAPEERNSRFNNVMDVPGITEAANKAMAIHDGKDQQYKPFLPDSYAPPNKKLEHWGIIPSNRKVDAAALAAMRPNMKVKDRIVHTAEHMRIAYQLIAKRYVQAHLPPATVATQTITIAVPTKDLLGHDYAVFKAQGRRLIDPGYMAFFPPEKKKDDVILQKLEKNDPVPLTAVELVESKTKCPNRFNEGSFEEVLLKAAKYVDDPVMRAYLADGVNKPEGIGTPSTRETVLPNLRARGYIDVRDKGNIFCEPKGDEYIRYQCDNGHEWMYRIETTAEWEGQLAQLVEIEDDTEALQFQAKFVDATITKIENYIHWMNNKYKDAGLAPLPRELDVVTPKLKELIQSVCKRKNIKVPSGALSDPKKAQAFLDEHGIKRKAPGEAGGAPGAPSDAQIDYVSKIEAALGIKIGEEDKKDRSKVSAFIEAHKTAYDKAKGQNPPTQAMINFAKKIIERLADDQKPGPEVLESYAACKQFLDKHAKDSKSGSSSGGSAGSKSSGGSARGSARPGSGSGRR